MAGGLCSRCCSQPYLVTEWVGGAAPVSDAGCVMVTSRPDLVPTINAPVGGKHVAAAVAGNDGDANWHRRTIAALTVTTRD